MNTTLMGHLMTQLTRNSLQAAVLVLAVLLAQWVSGKRLSPRWRCALWMLVVVRLLIPVSVGSTTSLFNIWPLAMQWVSAKTLPHQGPDEIPPFTLSRISTVPDAVHPQIIPHQPSTPQAGIPRNSLPTKNIHPLPPFLIPVAVLPMAALSTPGPAKSQPRSTVPVGLHPVKPMQPMTSTEPVPLPHAVTVSPAIPPPSTLSASVPSYPSHRRLIFFTLPPWPDCLLGLFGIWLAGATTLLGHIMVSSLRLARRCARLRPLDDPSTMALLQDCCHRMAMSRRSTHAAPLSPLTIVETVEVTSPALHGLWHPRLLLPKGFTAKFSAEELRFVLLHELAHLKRRDLWMSWVMAALQAIHWFNPLVWLAFARWRDDRELACDAMVLEATGAEQNQAYGEAILRLLEDFTHPMRTPGLVGILEEKRQMRQRIEMIAAYAPLPRWSLLAAVLIVGLTAIGLTDARSDNPTNTVSGAPVAKEAAPNVTLELRDGSRLVGKCLDDPIRFHAPSIGDITLPVAGIRSIEFTGKGGDEDLARLTATNGDTLDVKLAAPSLHVQTGFGKSELPVKMIRRIKVSSAGAAGQTGGLPSGLVALWTGNGNGNDSVGTNNAIVPAEITYAPAKIGEGFQFDGNTGGLNVPASPDLNVGAGSGFTLSCWIDPTSITKPGPLLEWKGVEGPVNIGVHLWTSVLAGDAVSPGNLYANIVDVNDNVHIFSTAPGIVQPGVFQQVALTYDKASGIGKLYYNGMLVASENLGSFTPKTDTLLSFGERLASPTFLFQGIFSDVAIFNRALSADEIQAIYNVQNGGAPATQLLTTTKPAIPGAGMSTNDTGSQVTLELRDGSRVVGRSLDDPIRFHSAALGDFKLPVAGIRSIEFNDQSDGSMARLTATNSDVLDVQFVAPSLHVQTGFGKSELPVNMIQSIKVSSPGRTLGVQANGTTEGVIQNPNFETPDVTGSDAYFNFITGIKNSGWTFKGMAGIAKNGSGYTYPAYRGGTPYGNQFAYLQSFQGNNGSMSQTLSNLSAGNYTFSFAASQRDKVGRDNSQNQTVNVLVDGISVGSFIPPDTNWYSYQTTPIPLSAGDHTLTFKCLLINGDATILIDNIGIQRTATPIIGTSTADAGTQLNIGLRDGSRVIGKSLDDPLKFHSASLGDLKLAVVGIRAIEFKGDDSMARLTATNGDVLDVKFVAPLLHVQTGFGKSELPVKMIQSIKVSSAANTASNGQSPSGLVALWTGNGNCDDSVGTNNAIVPAGITYAPAKVGEGFQFEGNSSGVSVPASPELNVGSGPGFTVMCWINPSSVSFRQPIIEWGNDRSPMNGVTYWGVHLWIAESFQGVGGPGSLYAGIADLEGKTHAFASPLGTLQAGILQQVGLTYDKATGLGNLYINGSLVASQNVGSFTAQTDGQLLIGERKDGGDVRYEGIINDVALFNRALTAEEIQTMYQEQDGGISLSPSRSLPLVGTNDPNNATSSGGSGSQLIFELKDGTRVVGKCLDDPLKFHSASLGDLKLPVVSIRSIEFTGKGDGSKALLTATNGDVLDVQCIAPSLHVETGFGKSELPVKMLRIINVLTNRNTGQNGRASGLIALRAGI
jgi:beta-lactamase regulating signal transducer with metallopeptidase domain